MEPKIIITTLLLLSALFELVGTITVLVNYFRTSKVVTKLIDNPDQFDKFKEKKRFNELVENLTSKWYLTVGLGSYILGSISGLLAGLIWLYS